MAGLRSGSAACVAALVIGGAALTGCSGAPDARGLRDGETLLTVSGTGRAEARPDQAVFTAGLETIGANAASASQRTNEAVARIVAALKAQGVAERDVQTSALSISRIDYGPNRGRYQAVDQVTVKVRDVAKAGAAIAAATQAGANVLSGPNLSVSDPERATLGAHAAAYRAARAKADAYAKAAGLRVIRPLSIGDSGEGGTMQSMAVEAMQERAYGPPPVVSPPPLLPGTNSQTVTVSVAFALGR